MNGWIKCFNCLSMNLSEYLWLETPRPMLFLVLEWTSVLRFGFSYRIGFHNDDCFLRGHYIARVCNYRKQCEWNIIFPLKEELFFYRFNAYFGSASLSKGDRGAWNIISMDYSSFLLLLNEKYTVKSFLLLVYLKNIFCWLHDYKEPCFASFCCVAPCFRACPLFLCIFVMLWDGGSVGTWNTSFTDFEINSSLHFP